MVSREPIWMGAQGVARSCRPTTIDGDSFSVRGSLFHTETFYPVSLRIRPPHVDPRRRIRKNSAAPANDNSQQNSHEFCDGFPLPNRDLAALINHGVDSGAGRPSPAFG